MKLITKNDIRITNRNPTSHKGDNGYVLAVGGSENYPGAIALAGLAALRSGADLLTILAPQKVAWTINSYSPDLITFKLHGKNFNLSHFKVLESLMKRHDVLLIGNGIGTSKLSRAFCLKSIKSIKKPKVIDADAIKSASMHDCENSILTPHQKELEIFMSNSKINESIIGNTLNEKNIEKKSIMLKKILQNFLDKNNVIILKGKIDTVISKDKILYNKTGNAGMTRGGTGDVLAGLCAGFLAQNKDLVQSAVNSAYFNGLIGDILLKKKKGFTYLASDMVNDIRAVSKRI